MEELPEVQREQQPLLFCCENDHDAVMRLKAQLEGKVFVVDCMVDRVCTGREISETGVDVQVRVTGAPLTGAPLTGAPLTGETRLSRSRDSHPLACLFAWPPCPPFVPSVARR